MAVGARPRAPAVAEDGRGLRQGSAPVPDLPDRPSRRGAGDPRPRAAEAAGRARLHGGTARRGRAEPLPDAPARGLALLYAPPRPRGLRRAFGLLGDPQPQGPEDPAAAALGRERGRDHRPGGARRRRPRELDPRPRRGRAGAPLRGRPAHLRGARDHPAGRSRRRYRFRDRDGQGRKRPARSR